MPQTFGLARVSDIHQNIERQIIALREFGVVDKNIFIEKESGKNFERPIYQQLLKKLKPGDVLVIKSLDRLGRNYDDLIENWRIITKKKRAAIVILDMPILDTREKKHDLTGRFIAELFLQIISYVAQTERETLLRRQAEGIAAAKARGVKFGRPPIERPANYRKVLKAWKNKEISAREAGRRLGVCINTFKAWAGSK